MKYLQTIVFALFLVASCNQESRLDVVSNINSSELPKADTIMIDEFYGSFDTVPNEFGINIFQDIVYPIEIESSEFRQVWSWEVKEIKHVIVRSTCSRIDPEGRYSPNSYLFHVEFISESGHLIAGSFIVDLDNETIGTYTLERDVEEFYGVSFSNDDEKIEDLKMKL